MYAQNGNDRLIMGSANGRTGAVTGSGSMVHSAEIKAQFAPETKQREVPDEVERLERALRGCMQGLDTLDSRLSESVLRSQPPVPAGSTGNTPTAVPQTALGARLQDLTSTAAIVNERIQSLINRLEV